MAGIRDRDFLAACARLASLLNLSSATARQRVDYQAAQEGAREPAALLAIAERMLAAAELDREQQGRRLDAQLNALAAEANFLDED
jgi:hypothetical protein